MLNYSVPILNDPVSYVELSSFLFWIIQSPMFNYPFPILNYSVPILNYPISHVELSSPNYELSSLLC